MPNYIRACIPGGSFIFTVVKLERHRALLTDHIDASRASFARTKQRRPFKIDAIVILPDHLHCIWTSPSGDTDYSGRWHAIKSAFSRALIANERLSTRRIAKGERGIWQRRFWEHSIRDEWDFAQHADYIHSNPVKHGHAARAADWLHSMFHRYVERGIYPLNWSVDVGVVDLDLE